MQASASRERQWMYSLLVHGFEGLAGPGGERDPHRRVEAFRRDRLRELVLSQLFEGYREPCPRGGAPRV